MSDLTSEQKIPLMIDWWHDAHAAIVDLGLYRSDLDRMAEETPVTYREGMRDVIASCERQRIPILVFSAGVAGTFSLCCIFVLCGEIVLYRTTL
jgi:hypothetical protein